MISRKSSQLIFLLILLGVAGYKYVLEEKDWVVVTTKIQGLSWVGERFPLEGSEFHLPSQLGVTSISQTPFGWQTHPNKPEIRWSVDGGQQWWGESGTGIQITLDSAQQYGISTLLKPHLWIRGSWPGEVAMHSESDWQQWFNQYEEFILDYARLAEKLSIPIFSIGTELEKTSHRTDEWKKIIREVRAVYSGKILYAANFTEFGQVKFWDQLDYIGIQAYFPLADRVQPSLEELTVGWRQPIAAIEKVVRRYHKSVIFTEIGYCNTDDAAIKPWVWPNERTHAKEMQRVQALCYTAFFQNVWNKPWLEGVYFWKWHPGEKPRRIGFSPQGLEAQEVLRSYFSDGVGESK